MQIRVSGHSTHTRNSIYTSMTGMEIEKEMGGRFKKNIFSITKRRSIIMKARETKTCCTSNVCCLRAQIGGVRKYIYAVKNHVPLGALYKFFEVNHPSTTGSRIVSVTKTNVKFGIVLTVSTRHHRPHQAVRRLLRTKCRRKQIYTNGCFAAHVLDGWHSAARRADLQRNKKGKSCCVCFTAG